MVRHIVIFRLTGPEELRSRLAAEFKSALEALPDEIPCLESIEVGINGNPAEDCDIVLTATVPAMEDVAAYAAHPAHVAAASIIKGHVGLRTCVDYEA